MLFVGLLALPVLALLRLTRVAAGHRSWALPAAAVLGVVWVGLRVLGAPVASTSAAALAVREVQAVRSGLHAQEILAREIPRDRFRATPGDRLLTGLRGKDVLLLFVESYGRVAVQGSSFSPGIDAVLDKGTAQLRAGGFSSRSAFLTSSTFGGLSWLAHSTLQSGIRIGTQRGYDQLVKSDRLTLSGAFKRAGWRAVVDDPVNKRTWPEGSSFYHYDKVYDRRNVGYRGPGFGLPPMPDQYVLSSLHRLELAKRHRPPLFAEVDLISSHTPWTRIPRLIPWDDVGDGSIFDRVPAEESTRAALFGDSDRARAAYGHSIEYTMSTIISYVQHYGDDKLVVVLLGDHQPPIVTGQGATHDVPISVIAHDPKVMAQIAGWGWQDGLLPSPQAPVWPMSAFRDRFLTAFGSSPAKRLTTTSPLGRAWTLCWFTREASCRGPARRVPRSLAGSLWATAGRARRRRRGDPPIRNLVISCQENRSFDSYFGFAPEVQRRGFGPPPGFSQPDAAGGRHPVFHRTALRSADPRTRGPRRTSSTTAGGWTASSRARARPRSASTPRTSCRSTTRCSTLPTPRCARTTSARCSARAPPTTST